MNQSIVKIWADIDHINIRISIDDLLTLAERHPEYPLKVVKISQFVKEYKAELENYAESNDVESGCSHLEWLIDQCIQNIYESGSDSVISLNEEED